MSQQITICEDYRIYNLVASGTLTGLRTLLNTAVAAAAVTTFPPGEILQVALTPDADIVITDQITGDTFTLTSGTRRVFPVLNIIDKIALTNVANVVCELYLDD